jgi:hypothetical protein
MNITNISIFISLAFMVSELVFPLEEKTPEDQKDSARHPDWWGHYNRPVVDFKNWHLQQPSLPVTITAQDGSQIVFTREDIKGLLSIIDKKPKDEE